MARIQTAIFALLALVGSVHADSACDPNKIAASITDSGVIATVLTNLPACTIATGFNITSDPTAATAGDNGAKLCEVESCAAILSALNGLDLGSCQLPSCDGSSKSASAGSDAVAGSSSGNATVSESSSSSLDGSVSAGNSSSTEGSLASSAAGSNATAGSVGSGSETAGNDTITASGADGASGSGDATANSQGADSPSPSTSTGAASSLSVAVGSAVVVALATAMAL